MINRIFTYAIRVCFILLNVVVFCGCNGILGSDTVDQNLPLITSPEEVRSLAIDFIADAYGNSAPPPGLNWVNVEIPDDGGDGGSIFQYIAGDWVIRVTYPLVTSDAAIYPVTITNAQEGFAWNGLVDAYGQVVTTKVAIDDTSSKPGPTATDTTEEPVTQTTSYYDDVYKIALNYPTDWTLTDSSPDQDSNGSLSKTLIFSKEDFILRIQYKFLWEKYVLGGVLPDGEVIDRGFVTLLGRLIPKRILVQNEKNKVIFYNDRFEHLEFFIRLDEEPKNQNHDAIDIPDDISSEMDAISESIVQTGLPAVPKTPTPVPTPTSIPIPCYAGEFIADITIPDGTIFAPNTKFTKIWRLENIGSCTWTTGYDLIFIDGEQLGAFKSNGFPEQIRPGEQVDLAVEMTSPDEPGNYLGRWMLRSNDGVIFGLGNEANKPFWVSISVVDTQGQYAYDFALNVCSAYWRSQVGNLSCSDTVDPFNGSVQLLQDPSMENRDENELALRIHPNEALNGWIEGIYPYFEVKKGDHFKTWVGCMYGYNKCSLQFYIDYQDEAGKIRRLGEWIEEYDGEVTKVDIDLSSLSGESVRFILGSKAITKNFIFAHGFWFVPRIER